MLLAVSTVVMFYGCEKYDGRAPAMPEHVDPTDPDDPTGEVVTEPAPCTNNVVAHRGGATEAGVPDNSLAALGYAMNLGLYGSECDIYWTADNNIVVAHGSSCKINGMYPWQHTASEIRSAGLLKNGEMIPLLEDYLKAVQVEDNCTKLIIDIKLINSPSTVPEYSINAVRRAVEIIQEAQAEKFVEFICTGNSTVMSSAYMYASAAGIPCAWMANKSATQYVSAGYPWANMSAGSYMNPGGGARTIDEFEKAKVWISVFNVDKTKVDDNSIADESGVNYYVQNASRLHFICTNYPEWLLSKIESFK